MIKNKEILKYIQCPICRNNLKLNKYFLYCKMNHYFEIKNGVVNLFSEIDKGTLKSANNWTTQWNKYTFRNTIWEKRETFLEHIPIKLKNTTNKNILEIGCGNGRDIKHFLNKGNKIFAIDISESTHYANKRYKEEKNVFIIRCDAMNLPFKDNTFELIYSDHVLQHIKDLNKCFKELKRTSKENNQFIFNLYKSNFIMEKIIEPIKRLFLLKLNINILHLLSLIPAIVLWIILKLIYYPKINIFKNIKFKLPLENHMGFWINFKFNIVWQTCFDLIHAPIAYYFNDKMIEDLINKDYIKKNKITILRKTLWILNIKFIK